MPDLLRERCREEDCMSDLSQSDREPQTAAELADEQIARYQQAIKDGTGNLDVCRDMIDRWLDHRFDFGDEPRLPL